MFSEEGKLKIIDFGMSRKFGPEIPFSQNTFAISYRPPEILLGAKYYGPAADMWTVGCILAEILIKKPLFLGA